MFSGANTILASKYVKLLVLCWFSFAILELWVYLSAFQNPFASSSHLLWETPVSLILLLAGFVFGFLYFWRESGSRLGAACWIALGVIFLTLPSVSLTPLPASEWRIEVYKSARRLDLYHHDQKRQSYRIGLGGHPEGSKEVMSDGKTPLGRFIICDKGPSQFHKWLGLNYPTPQDAWRGRKTAKITWAELWYIRVENLNGKIPYGNSALGGAIGIHGGGSDKDWTLGCIALENKHIDEFYDELPLGTEVVVYE